MEISESFKLSFFQFLNQYQMGKYKANSDLNILLLGDGPQMEFILSSVVANGQLPDTNLKVTVGNAHPEDTLSALKKNAPYLPHFAVFSLNGQPAASDVPLEENLCSLSFQTSSLTPEAAGTLLAEHPCCRYILISTGDDALNRSLAEAAAQASRTEDAIIGYVQSERPAAAIAADGKPVKVIPFGFDENFADNPNFKKLEDVALNLHYSYMKSADDKASIADIKKTFEKPYNYISNIESALHLNAKLTACGIGSGELKTCAAAFSNAIANDPALVERLSAAEHRRWMMSKVLSGYVQLADLNQIYRNGNTTHSSGEKWHTCLVPASPDSSLESSDWQDTVPSAYRAGLDALDRISLQLHAKCGEISRSEANLTVVNQMLDLIRLMLTDPDITEQLDHLEYAIAEMRMPKKSAVSFYKSTLHALKAHTEGRDFRSFTMLKLLDNEIQPLIEYLSLKDYKEQDRILVRSIPFALTHRFGPTIVKLLSEKPAENLHSLRQLEPERAIFVGAARTRMELTACRETIRKIREYLDRDAFKALTAEYLLLVPENLYEQPAGQEQLIPVSNWNPETIAAALHNIQGHVDYLDVTGCHPLLALASKAYADNVGAGIFYIWNEKFCSLNNNAEELSYHTIMKSLSVSEMFALCGAEQKDVSSGQVTGLTSKIREIWKIRWNHDHGWKDLCNNIRDILIKKFDLKGGKSGEIRIAVQKSVLPAFRKLLREFEYRNWLTCTAVEPPDIGKPCYFQLELKAGIASPSSFEKALQDCVNLYDEKSCYFETGAKSFCLKTRKREKIPLRTDEEREVLQQLSDIGCLSDFTITDEGASFCFAADEVLHLFDKAGNLLEAYIYYSCLSEGGFDDVETGFSFSHSSDAQSAKNELDVLAVKGLSSLFISCKDIKYEKNDHKQNDHKQNNHEETDQEKTDQKKTDYEETDHDFLKNVCYEITNLAEHFGINAKPVLVWPNVNMYGDNAAFSSSFVTCRSRGVYLIGKEIFDADQVGDTLKRIAAGDDSWYCHASRPGAAAD